MQRLLVFVALAALVRAATAGPPEGVTYFALRDPDDNIVKHRLEVLFKESLNANVYKKYVEHNANEWVLTKNGGPTSDFDIAAVVLLDDDMNATNDLLGFNVDLPELETSAKYELEPSNALKETLEGLQVTPQELLPKRVLWIPGTNPYEPPEVKEGFTRILNDKFLVLDIQPAANSDDSAAVNIDYTLRFDHIFSEVDPAQGTNWHGSSISIESVGFLRVPDDDDGGSNGLDSIVSTLSFQTTWTLWKEEVEDFNIFLASDEERERARVKGYFDAFDFTLDAHLKHETVQDFDDNQYAVGIGASAMIPFPRMEIEGDGIPLPLLPLAPVLAINRESLAAVQQPWFALSFDYVFNAGDTDRSMFSDDDEFMRLLVEIGWTSEVVAPNTWAYLNFSGWWEINAPGAIKDADRDFRHYVEAGIKVPLQKEGTGSPWLIVKFQDGALPPNFGDDTQIKAGISFDF